MSPCHRRQVSSLSKLGDMLTERPPIKVSSPFSTPQAKLSIPPASHKQQLGPFSCSSPASQTAGHLGHPGVWHSLASSLPPGAPALN